MRESTARTPLRDMEPSGFARVLEIFYGGNTEVDAAVVFDKTGETVDYHSYMDPYDARLMAAHMGIIFHLAHYKMEWLAKAKLDTLEISCEGFYAITIHICEEYFLLIVAKPENADPALLDAVVGSVEALRKEIGC